jgi:hypothetical protein
MPTDERPTESCGCADAADEAVTAGAWPRRLQQQWDAVLESLGQQRSDQELRAAMQLFMESQQLIAASLSSYFAALGGRTGADAVTEQRLSELERRMASMEQSVELLRQADGAGDQASDARRGDSRQAAAPSEAA